MTPRLLLVGAEYPQLFVLEAMARGRFPPHHAVLICPTPTYSHPPLLAGLLTGRYDVAEAGLPLGELARAAGAEFLIGRVERIDESTRSLGLTGGATLPYDVLSIAGAESPERWRPSVNQHAWLANSIESVAGIARDLDAATSHPQPEPVRVLVVGGGVRGIEMALALRMRLDRLNVTTAVVTLVEAAHELLDGAPSGAILEAHRALKRGEISLRLSAKVEEAGPHHVRLANGAVLPADLTVWAGGAPPANWLSACGLPSGSEGALQVEPTLRSPAAPHVFAAGSAAMLGSTRRGWNRFALARRQGPVLAENLALTLRALASNQLARSVSGLQSVHLNDRSLFSLDGQDRAMLWWGEWGVTSRWGIAIKERLDRSALRRFQALCSE